MRVRFNLSCTTDGNLNDSVIELQSITRVRCFRHVTFSRQANAPLGAIHLVRTHKLPDFRPPPPPLYAHIMTSLWKQYIGVRKALDPPPPFGPYVLNEWPLSVPPRAQNSLYAMFAKFDRWL